jgi:antitoxin component YwqK of YwqJK toxin-antitoxin module
MNKKDLSLSLAFLVLGIFFVQMPDAWAMECTLNGHTVPQDCFKSGKCGSDTGRIFCKQGDAPYGEWEIRQGKHIGYEATYDVAGDKTERNVDEQGKIDGTMKRFSPQGILIWEKDYAHGNAQGQNRTFFPSGRPQEIEWWEDGHVLFDVAYLEDGRLLSLDCGKRPYVDEAVTLCGFNNKPSRLQLAIPGSPDKTRTASYLNGELLTTAVMAQGNGAPLSQQSFDGDTHVSKEYFPDGKIKIESSYKGNRLNGKEIEYHSSGQVIRETIWDMGEKISEDIFFLNGQKKSHEERVRQGDQWLATDKTFYDNGKPETEGGYLNGVPIGEHRTYNDAGTLIAVAIYDDKGRIEREKSWDANGKLVSDDAVFEDGSRKSFNAQVSRP